LYASLHLKTQKISVVNCPEGYQKKTPGRGKQDCRYNLKTISNLSIPGCSHECYKEEVEQRCCPGYWGIDCIECPGSAATPCNRKGVCSDGMGGNGTCTCKAGFVGTACEECDENLYGPMCSTVCTCKHGLCNSGLKGNGQCTCFSGYTGPDCDQELPGCAALRCGPDALCFEDVSSGKLACKCKSGYAGDGVQCTSINPCVRSVCHQHAVCVHTGPNQHTCTCTEGYQGDGLVCLPIDPCQTNFGSCQSHSTRCVYDGPGKAHCECLPGFEKLVMGVGCSLRDACKPDSCHKNAYCTNVAPGTVECTCRQGFLGNGKICFGNIMQRLQDLNSEPGSGWTGQLSNGIRLFGDVLLLKFIKYTYPPQVKTLVADEAKARYLVKMHMVAGEVTSDFLKKGILYYTLTGKLAESITEVGKTVYVCCIFYTFSGQILINGIAVVEADVEAKNGRLYSLDGVLIPQSIEPILPHRCDTTDKYIYKAPCVSCRFVSLSTCPTGASLVRRYTRHITPKCCEGFFGQDCSPCPGGFSTPCSSHGKCFDGINGNGTCQCEPNFKGSRCQYCADPNKYGPSCDQTCGCVQGVCDNRPEAHGTCKPGSCEPGFAGQLCDKHAQPCGPNQPCHAHANCVYSEGACVCKHGFQGDGFLCAEVDACASPPNGGCSKNANCIKTGPGTHRCECVKGWREDGDECQPVNNCLEPSRGGCHPNASCIHVGPGQNYCVCKQNYRGNGRECEAVNECVEQIGGCHPRVNVTHIFSQIKASTYY
uniref:EGF-like domain-containing protein n=1 Tax=Pygocentrus nattereri TaxID=42514 RepID=A0AAR2KQ22_PYGNA